MTESAILAGGCFWCLEAAYDELEGVVSVQSGYAGGHVEHPSYKQVCSGATGHAEVVKVEYDPSVISYADLLRVFFTIHDPTMLNRQGNDIGTQYRSAIFYAMPEQKAAAEAAIAEFTPIWGKIVTEILPLTIFWPAEAEHENYFARNPWSGYCQAIIAPKIAKLRKNFHDRLKKA
ncbi:peptide-methionine (S)-S-oxide reductase MsrA [Acidocella aminolytica]|jgi:peptide-methionine (S)-S-oxide reductase|uniref:Peptide methionine sulfoxide reductase MsrA n=1 Tax=Acidocella aminolytica 101 = DSM 11237 TaxID=1120923 RepID=A0A0D6PBV8_9PROT|nr:peptide-methionine (S)-S-oxide reductase MsrA [Acidocella aminolytica]GAN78683.1 methionine sulfoxide reductase A [Acidocella aminolytica 101 = DSM 11237]GBQ36623.1 methionine sulfoxide reductase A [Acidocella aminolytica 101 = DSM 11237]SHE45220.1 peptide-methionine (S)-S-oxide reductase [Acidocella aminolytica 101 = DSM 11237]